MISDETISRYIDNQLDYYETHIDTRKNILREAKYKYNISCSIFVNKSQYQATKRYLFKKFMKETLQKLKEIDSNFKPVAKAEYLDNYYYFE